jgi:hypothetical protein
VNIGQKRVEFEKIIENQMSVAWILYTNDIKWNRFFGYTSVYKHEAALFVTCKANYEKRIYGKDNVSATGLVGTQNF